MLAKLPCSRSVYRLKLRRKHSVLLLAWNHRQEHMRGMSAVMQNCLSRGLHLRIRANPVAGIQVAVPAREVAAGHVQTDTMPRFEQVARCPQINRVLIGC